MGLEWIKLNVSLYSHNKYRWFKWLPWNLETNLMSLTILIGLIHSLFQLHFGVYTYLCYILLISYICIARAHIFIPPDIFYFSSCCNILTTDIWIFIFVFLLLMHISSILMILLSLKLTLTCKKRSSINKAWMIAWPHWEHVSLTTSTRPTSVQPT